MSILLKESSFHHITHGHWTLMDPYYGGEDTQLCSPQCWNCLLFLLVCVTCPFSLPLLALCWCMGMGSGMCFEQPMMFGDNSDTEYDGIEWYYSYVKEAINECLDSVNSCILSPQAMAGSDLISLSMYNILKWEFAASSQIQQCSVLGQLKGWEAEWIYPLWLPTGAAGKFGHIFFLHFQPFSVLMILGWPTILLSPWIISTAPNCTYMYL